MASPKKDSPKKDIAKLSYEQALEQLEHLLERVESGDIGLEDSLGECERGNELLQHCRGILGRVEKKLQTLTLASNPSPDSSASPEADESARDDDENADVPF